MQRVAHIDPRTAIPWLQLILKAVFVNGRASLVWRFIHPDTRAWLIRTLIEPTPDDTDFAALVENPSIDLDRAVVKFFRFNLDSYDHERWGVFSETQPTHPAILELFIAKGSGRVEAGEPLEVYRAFMQHDPDVDPAGHEAGWYLIGIKGEILK